jgi:ABC-type dipeptide/oligopeptide/nickel transport system ATPase component
MVKRKQKKDESLKRVKKQTILFNSLEMGAIHKYCNQFRIRNRSKFMREAIVTEVLKRFDKNYPTLFDNQLRLF